MKLPDVEFMSFGKHKGRPIKEIPDDYLAWVLKTVDLREPLESALRNEWDRRHRPEPEPDPVPAATTGVLPNLKAMRRKFAARFHPDHGGSAAEMRAVNCVFDELEKVMR